MRSRRAVHVCTDRELAMWKVSRSGRTLSRHRTKARAVSAGKRVARRELVELVTHDRAGRIRSSNSYGYESPARDTER